ncbi:hypothetical protein CS542_01605 [Pedobacter sp. IW39]|nr:hypothetical protein CS542_01605 [Pedobacter sp. IW39]
MQENRSFDHAFGSLKESGASDPRAIRLPDDHPVWLQTNKRRNICPFQVRSEDTRATWMNSATLVENQVDARNYGDFNGWLEAKDPE